MAMADGSSMDPPPSQTKESFLRASQLHSKVTCRNCRTNKNFRSVWKESEMACLSEVGEGAFGTIFHVCDQNGCGGGGGE